MAPLINKYKCRGAGKDLAAKGQPEQYGRQHPRSHRIPLTQSVTQTPVRHATTPCGAEVGCVSCPLPCARPQRSKEAQQKPRRSARRGGPTPETDDPLLPVDYDTNSGRVKQVPEDFRTGPAAIPAAAGRCRPGRSPGTCRRGDRNAWASPRPTSGIGARRSPGRPVGLRRPVRNRPRR